MAKPDDLRANAAHDRKLAALLDPQLATLCRELAERCDREAVAHQPLQTMKIPE